MLRHALPGALALACLAAAARADDAPSRCISVAVPHGVVAEHGSHWVALRESQRAFLAGVYVLNPRTGTGLPLGDSAVMASGPNSDGAIIFWIDGAMACDPMPIPSAIVGMVIDIGKGTVRHEGDGL